MTDPLRLFGKLPLANRLANAHLHRARALLPQAELTTRRPAYFGSIQATLNHILMVDRFYLNALESQRLNRAALDEALACPDLQVLTRWQAEADGRLIAHVGGLAMTDLAATIMIDRGAQVQEDRRDDILLHLLTHQVHHRGQVHHMLSATSVRPPQLDEFIVGDDHAARAEAISLLGWSETNLMR